MIWLIIFNTVLWGINIYRLFKKDNYLDNIEIGLQLAIVVGASIPEVNSYEFLLFSVFIYGVCLFPYTIMVEQRMMKLGDDSNYSQMSKFRNKNENQSENKNNNEDK